MLNKCSSKTECKEYWKFLRKQDISYFTVPALKFKYTTQYELDTSLFRHRLLMKSIKFTSMRSNEQEQKEIDEYKTKHLSKKIIEPESDSEEN